MKADSQKPYQKIVLCEWGMHQEVLYSYLMHFHPLAENMTICTYRWVACQLQEMELPKHITWITEDVATDFFQECQHALMDCDFTIITTLPPKKSKLDHLDFPNPVFLLIHNTHFQLWQDFQEPTFAFGRNSLHQYIKWMSYKYTGALQRQKLWLQKVSNIIFSSYAMKKYYLDRTASNLRPNPMVIPSGHHIFVQKSPLSSGKLTIGIPGNVNSSKKDYSMLAEGLKFYAESQKTAIEVICMGKCDASGMKIIRKMETKLQATSIKFITYTDYISHQDYTSILLGVDLLIWNFKTIKPYGPCNEMFGYTTQSGAVGDMLKFGVPSVIPAFYPLPEELEHLVARYHDAQSMASAISMILARKSIASFSPQLSSFQHPAIGSSILQQLQQHVEEA